MFVERPVVGLISGLNRSVARRGFLSLREPIHILLSSSTIRCWNNTTDIRQRMSLSSVRMMRRLGRCCRYSFRRWISSVSLRCRAPRSPIVLEAMAYRAPCVAMAKYGMPAEVAGAGVVVKADWDHFGNFHVPMTELSETINAELHPSTTRTQYENSAESVAQQYTRKKAAQELIRVFAESSQRKIDDFRTESMLFLPVFCRQYEPDTGAIRSCAYRLGTNRYDGLEPALAEVLGERHTPAEVASVFKHFRRAETTSDF